MLSLNSWEVRQDASINELFSITNQQDASLNDIIDITNLFVPNASLGTDFKWESGYLEASIGQDSSIIDLYVYVEDLSTYTYSLTNFAKSPFQTLTLANAADSSIAWYVRNGWNAKYTLTKDVSLMIPDVSHGDSGTLLLIEDASGTWKMNLPANSFILSDASTITKTAGAKNFLTFVYDISTFYWNLGKNYIAQTQV